MRADVSGGGMPILAGRGPCLFWLVDEVGDVAMLKQLVRASLHLCGVQLRGSVHARPSAC